MGGATQKIHTVRIKIQMRYFNEPEYCHSFGKLSPALQLFEYGQWRGQCDGNGPDHRYQNHEGGPLVRALVWIDDKTPSVQGYGCDAHC